MHIKGWVFNELGVGLSDFWATSRSKENEVINPTEDKVINSIHERGFPSNKPEGVQWLEGARKGEW